VVLSSHGLLLEKAATDDSPGRVAALGDFRLTPTA